MLRFLLTALFAFLTLSNSAFAQRATCTDGTAVFQGTTYTCDNVDLLSRVTLQQMSASSGNDSWGWTDPISGDEYAIMGLNNGTFFVDISQPESPRLLGKLPTQTQSSTWRDMKVYENHVFVVSEASGHGMQVFDLMQLRGLSENPNRVFQPNATFFGSGQNTLGSAHNIAINEDTGYAYVVGGRQQSGFSRVCNGGLMMINIQNPTEPEFAGCFSAVGYIHDVQCVMYQGPDQTYQGREICFASNAEFPIATGVHTLTVADVTNKSNPVTLSATTYSNPGYSHQGWLTDDHRYFLLNDELDEQTYGSATRTILFDVESLTSPDQLPSLGHGTQSITHNHYVRGQHSFHANYTSGLNILDLSPLLAGNRDTPATRVAFFDTYPQNNGLSYDGAWNVYPFFASGTVLVSDINNGLFMVKAQFPLTDAEPNTPDPSVTLEAFPNPFGSQLTVEVTLDTTQVVRVEVFDVLGRRVATLHDATLAAGATPLSLDATGLPSGVFIVRATGETFTRTLRVTRTR